MKATPIESCFDQETDDGVCLDSNRAAGHPWWLYANLLSLDAPLVAVVWLGAFSRAFHSPVALPVYTLLFLSVWSIYLADRLVDSFRQQQWALATERHIFVRRHYRIFLGLLAANISLGAGLAFTSLPMDLILAGLALCLVVACYFGVFVRVLPQWKPLRAKEFACGLVFAVGTVLGIDAIRHGAVENPGQVIPGVFLFAALCAYNCLIISASESVCDQANDSSAASNWWRHLDRDLIILGAALLVASGAGCLLGRLHGIYIACSISAFLLIFIHLFHGKLSQALTRVLVDAVLLSPVLLWF